jgi:hypothetical protein
MELPLTAAKEPGVQAAQAEDPRVAVTDPAGHSWHDVEPVLDWKRPGGQDLHTLLWSYVPAAHAEQAVLPGTGATVPGTQEMHRDMG